MSELYGLVDYIVSAVMQLNAHLKTPDGARLAAFISVGSAVFAALTLFLHRRAERYTWDAQRLFYLHEFLSTPHHMNARRRIRELIEDQTPLRDWSPEARRSADIVCGAYDQAGVLLFVRGAVSPRQQYNFLRTSWGVSIQEQHAAINAYQAFVESQANKEHRYTLGNYFVHFGELNDAAAATRSWYWIWRFKRFWYWLTRQRPTPKPPRQFAPAEVQLPEASSAPETARIGNGLAKDAAMGPAKA